MNPIDFPSTTSGPPAESRCIATLSPTQAVTPATTGLTDAAPAPGYRLDAIPLATLRSTTWRERLAQWRALCDTPLYPEDGRLRAARQAERQAHGRISVHHAARGGHVFSNKRIPRDPRAAAMGRFEADLIAITPRRVVLLEVKNWSGELRAADDHWVQVQRSGAEIRHPNLLLHNREKLRALHRYLQHAGVAIKEQRFHQAVIFANRRLEIAPAIEQHPAVLQMHDVWDVLGTGTSRGQRAAARLLQWLMDAEGNAAIAENVLDQIPPAQAEAAAQAVQGLRSWDRLTLRGGRELQGDIIWLRICGIQATPAALKSGGSVTLHWRRGWIGGFQWVVRNLYPGQMRGDIYHDQHRIPGGRLPLTAEDCAYFHEPGKTRPELIALSHVERIQIG